MNRILAGAIAGAVATALMTIVISVGKVMGLLTTPPPEQITASVTRRSGIGTLPAPEFTAESILAHHGFGVVGGAIYVLLRRILPAPAPVAGLIFGAVVWSIAYIGVLPALRLYPWPDDDRSSRKVVMIIAHAIYGVTLAETENRLAERF